MSTPSRPETSKTVEQLRLSGQLPSPKGVALAIMDICRRDDATIEAIARIVQVDPALSSRLIHLANAAATAGGRPVASVPDAIQRLGMVTVRQVAVCFSLMDQYHTGPCKAFDYDRFWSHSLLMAVAMQALGAFGRLGSPDELFACGLLARIGYLALATVHPAEYSALLEKCPDQSRLAELERAHLQADHNDFTAAILADCGIPGALAEPVYHHETPDRSGFAEGSRPYQLVQLLHHARRVADMGLAPDHARSGIISELMLLGGKLGLDGNELGDVLDRILARWGAWGELLHVPARRLPSFASMAAAPAPKSDAPKTSAIRVLLVEDEPTSRMLLEAQLISLTGPEVHSASNGEEALALALKLQPHIIVTDRVMPVMDGIALSRALRATDWGQSMYVLMLTGVDTEEEIVEAFEAGVDDYVTKPVNLRALSARMRAALHYVQLLEAWERDRAQLKQFASELAISNRKLEHLALTDLLTGLPNRRAGMATLSQAWSAATRSRQGMSVMMVDIDRFKSINDTHGHAVGDRVLADVARLLRASARNDDHVIRLGGEEFLVICQNTDLRSTLEAAERLRRKVAAASIEAGRALLHVSISIGVASRESTMPDPDSMLAAADQALYAAKQGGRDRVCLNSAGSLICRSTR
ncbi:diguanylate cyclase [Zoogloea sp.]|uniref:sensor domain-containing diguanylate cyclase n=1 Tax=Zoogloea sp. TaxID=49181 RepID=UPI00262A1FAD|nr:diguanylate cyclase [Zoogloea sp.]